LAEAHSVKTEGLLPARAGVGPLLQRDYWAAVRGARLKPSEIATELRAHFPSFVPSDLAEFEKPERGGLLELGDELDIRIAGAGDCKVRVVHFDAQSLTLATAVGHPEAGRITFGCYRDGRGALVVHIRSRARSDSFLRLMGFIIVGEAMQTNTWTHFISRVAAFAGGEVEDRIHAEMDEIDGDDGEEDVLDQPTFLARND